VAQDQTSALRSLSLQESALRKVAEEVTTFEVVVRVTGL